MDARFDLFSVVRRLFDRPRPGARSNRAPQPYHAVTIRPGRVACTHANALLDRRFLAKDAPRLPLPECDRETCECTFAHYQDRRNEKRRAQDADGRPRRHDGHNTRLGTGRRQADHDTSFDSQYFEHISSRGADDDRS
jgi:hypothetical protein